MLRRWLRKGPTSAEAALEALRRIREQIERLNIPVIMDDQDAGYDMAIDEVLVLIDDAINQITSDNDVDYSGGL